MRHSILFIELFVLEETISKYTFNYDLSTVKRNVHQYQPLQLMKDAML